MQARITDPKIKEAFKKIFALTVLAGFVVLVITMTYVQTCKNNQMTMANISQFKVPSVNENLTVPINTSSGGTVVHVAYDRLPSGEIVTTILSDGE